MRPKIRCDEKSWKIWHFGVQLNMALRKAKKLYLAPSSLVRHIAKVKDESAGDITKNLFIRSYGLKSNWLKLKTRL